MLKTHKYALGSLPRRGGAEGGASLCSLVSDDRAREGHRAVPGEGKAGREEKCQYHEGGHTPGRTSCRDRWCPVPVSAQGTFGQCPW